MSFDSTGSDYLDLPLRALVGDVAGADSVPAAGSVVAVLGALAAGLTAKVAHRSASRLAEAEEIAAQADVLRGRFEPVITADAAGYADALAASGDHRTSALHALSVELAVMGDAAADVAELAANLVTMGNPNLRFDADAAVRIAVTVAEISAKLIGANVGESELVGRSESAAARARNAAAHASRPVG